jgi:hypothetical protein
LPNNNVGIPELLPTPITTAQPTDAVDIGHDPPRSTTTSTTTTRTFVPEETAVLVSRLIETDNSTMASLPIDEPIILTTPLGIITSPISNDSNITDANIALLSESAISPAMLISAVVFPSSFLLFFGCGIMILVVKKKMRVRARNRFRDHVYARCVRRKTDSPLPGIPLQQFSAPVESEHEQPPVLRTSSQFSSIDLENEPAVKFSTFKPTGKLETVAADVHAIPLNELQEPVPTVSGYISFPKNEKTTVGTSAAAAAAAGDIDSWYSSSEEWGDEKESSF